MIIDVLRAQLAPYLILIRVGLVVAVLVLTFTLGWKAGSGHASGQWERAAAKQAAEYQSSLARAREAERASYAKSQEVSRAYEDELERLRAAPVDRRPVRLCLETPRPAGMPAAGTAAGKPGEAVPAGGLVQSAGGIDPAMWPGPNIGPALRGVARRADEVSAQGRRIQSVAVGVPST